MRKKIITVIDTVGFVMAFASMYLLLYLPWDAVSGLIWFGLGVFALGSILSRIEECRNER